MSAWCSRSVHVIHVVADQEHSDCAVPRYRCHGDLVPPHIGTPRYQITGQSPVKWYPHGTISPGYPSVSTRLGHFGPPIEVICLLCSSAHLSSYLWSTNVDKSSSIWLLRSRYCRTIQKNTCAATARSLVTARSLWSSHRSNLLAL